MEPKSVENHLREHPGTSQGPGRPPQSAKERHERRPGGARSPPGAPWERKGDPQGRPGESKIAPGRPKRLPEATKIYPRSPLGVKKHFVVRKPRSKQFSGRFVLDFPTKTGMRFECKLRAQLASNRTWTNMTHARFTSQNTRDSLWSRRSDFARAARQIDETTTENDLETRFANDSAKRAFRVRFSSPNQANITPTSPFTRPGD